MVAKPFESVEEAKELYRNDPAFNKYVNGLISIMKDDILTPEQIITGCTLAIGEFEYHIEPKIKGLN